MSIRSNPSNDVTSLHITFIHNNSNVNVNFDMSSSNRDSLPKTSSMTTKESMNVDDNNSSSIQVDEG